MAHTAGGSLRFGIDEKKLAAVWEYRTSPLYTEAERAALDLSFKIRRDRDVSPRVPDESLRIVFRCFRMENDVSDVHALGGVPASEPSTTRWIEPRPA